MAKILLVEDDNNLREIYEARLMAEGYEIVSARDGEEALTVAMKEKPDLIISDVMMPKISGFDMLDILRTTEETKNAKVIMMTALSQAEDKARAEKLGADRYLVKSQVTLEDVAKVAKQVLEGEPSATASTELPAPAAAPAEPASASTPTAPSTSDPTPTPIPVPSAIPPTEPAAAPAEPASAPLPAPAPIPEPAQTQPIPTSDPTPTPIPVPASDPAPALQPESNDDDTTEPVVENEDHKKKVIQPINNLHEDPQAKLNDLLEKEKEREQMAQTVHQMVQETQTAVSTEPGVDATTPETPVTPPPGAGSEVKPDPNSIAL